MTYESPEAADDRLAARLAPALALLAAVGETGHVTRAAEQLGIPQPTASRRLAALSDLVGAPLVLPSGRGIRLTRTGRTLAAASGRALGALATAAREVREEIDPASGRVVLGFLHLLGRTLVPSLIRRFRERNPGVRFSLAQGSRQDMLRALREGDIDLVFVAPMPLGDPDLAGRPLADQELVLAVPPGHRLAGRARVRAAELEGEELVTLEHGYGLRQITDDLCAAAGFEPRIAFEGQESETVRGLVAAGLGVAVLPSTDPGLGAPARTDPGLGAPARTDSTSAVAGVVEVPMSPPLFRTIGVCWVAGERLTPAARAFRDHACAAPLDLGPGFRPPTVPGTPD
ncbi:LysR family transcriptional regulator [Nonomuraea wenchangensis]|uniref:DNA-binding transcriptional regulator, LysR family n=1 Tax=Nonomuraea wenchangensis TaxID=568860 RepID=A0A1I0K7X3_9ACTN|nr:LysR family transcriptional regulator [Nonomuraea wenchangensis]SEU19784.1 DNA-binding transcriptional regulator, LysR family [Nonomuraea wenchangensis]